MQCQDKGFKHMIPPWESSTLLLETTLLKWIGVEDLSECMCYVITGMYLHQVKLPLYQAMTYKAILNIHVSSLHETLEFFAKAIILWLPQWRLAKYYSRPRSPIKKARNIVSLHASLYQHTLPHCHWYVS